MPNHANPLCIFKLKPYLFKKEYLRDYKTLLKLDPCSCFQFALIHNHPSYANYQVELDEFQEFVESSDAWEFYKETDYKYNLNSGRDYFHRDPYVKKAFKQYDPATYYRYCDANKTPKTGSMYWSLLSYLYPISKVPRHSNHSFYASMSKAINHVFSNFDESKPISVEEAINVMPKNTSAGFNGLVYSGDGTRRKKEDILPFIRDQYYFNLNQIERGIYPNDYCMFAMRGHLSSRLKKKTRPVWLVSASTIVAELRYYTPFYDQINSKPFFKNMWITGPESLPRLNRYLRRHPDATFYNTDISSWDSYRASWFHEKIMRCLERKLILNPLQRKEYNYCVQSAIYTKVLFPDGTVYKKKAGIISGTAGTLLFNSLLNTVASYIILNMMKYVSLDNQFDFVDKIIDPNWLGDDFSFYTYIAFDLDRFSRLMFMYFNLEMKPEKTIIAREMDDRKYLGYQLKSGFLYRPQKEFIQALLYTERPFPEEHGFSISFSRFFSYLLLGGINDYYILDFFYYYMGLYRDEASMVDDIYMTGIDNIFKLLKDVWNVKIPNFTLDTLRNINLELMKYVLLYGYDLRFKDLNY
jgi:hypothetical protein